MVLAPFQHWGLDFIGQFKNNSSNGFSWILTATHYFTKWVEAIPTKRATDKVVLDFLENKIITRLGAPTKITTDNAKDFHLVDFTYFFFKYDIVLSHSSDYYPHGNGLAKSSNKTLMTILNKKIGNKKMSWDSKIKYAVWDDRITMKSATRKTPFELVYGLTVSFLVYLQLPAMKMLQEYEMEEESMCNMINHIIELDENQRNVLDISIRNREKV